MGDRYLKAFYRLPRKRREELEAEFKRVNVEFASKTALAYALGDTSATDPKVYGANLIDFASARMPSRSALSEDEFFGLAAHCLETQADHSKPSKWWQLWK